MKQLPSREYAGQTFEADDERFMLDRAQRTPEPGEAIAREIGVWPLTEKRWIVITSCREDAARQGRSPGLGRIVKNAGIGREALYRLLPSEPAALAARIAGLPRAATRVGKPKQRRRCADGLHLGASREKEGWTL